MARASNRPAPEPAPLPTDSRPAIQPRRLLRARREEPTDRLYEVIGEKQVGGKSKGETVLLSLTDAQEQVLIETGHVKPVKEPVRPSLAEKKEG